MAAQPQYITQPNFDAALTAFSGHVDHTINMAKAEFRREIVESENRLRTEIKASETRLQIQIQESEARLQIQIQESEARLQAQIDSIKTELKDMRQQIDRVENVGKQNHQMFQIMLDQFSKINKKLGID